jgi:predicted SpoU family rRNA methylase
MIKSGLNAVYEIMVVVGAGSKPARNYEVNMVQVRFGTCPYSVK